VLMLPASEPACEQHAGFLLLLADACAAGVASGGLGWWRRRCGMAQGAGRLMGLGAY